MFLLNYLLAYNLFRIIKLTPTKVDASVTNITSCLKCERLTILPALALAKVYSNEEFSIMRGRQLVLRKVAEALETVLLGLGVTIGLS